MFEGEYSRRDVDLRCAPSNDAETRLAYHSHEVGCSTFSNNSSGFWCSDHTDVDGVTSQANAGPFASRVGDYFCTATALGGSALSIAFLGSSRGRFGSPDFAPPKRQGSRSLAPQPELLCGSSIVSSIVGMARPPRFEQREPLRAHLY